MNSGEKLTLSNEYKVRMTNICVFGVGGAGSAIVDRMAANSMRNVRYFAVDAFSSEPCGYKYAEPLNVMCGEDEEPSEDTAKECISRLRSAMEWADFVYTVAGAGGETGSHVAPVIAGIARKEGKFNLAVLIEPFESEGDACAQRAEKCIEGVKKYADAYTTVSNRKILEAIIAKENADVPCADFEARAMSVADGRVIQGLKPVLDSVTVPAVINIDPEDVRSIFKDAGRLEIAIGVGSGEEKVYVAMSKVLDNSLTYAEIGKARRMIVSVEGGSGMGLSDVNAVADRLHKVVDADAYMALFVDINSDLGDEMIITALYSV